MKKKNVLIILTDQQRKDSLGCYGNTVTRTPNLDRLASEGIRFNRGYVANPICMPSRLSLFTGMYPRNHGVWTNGVFLNQERTTMATELLKCGYQTASFGKIHFTPTGANIGNRESREGWRQQADNFDWNGPYWGFEQVELTIGHTLPIAHYGRWFKEKGGDVKDLERQPILGAMQSGVTNISKDLHDSSFIGEKTVDFIKEKRVKDKPFFAVASFPDPHIPFNPPQECAEKYSNGEIIQPVGSSEDLETRPKHYAQHFRGEWSRKGVVSPGKHPEGISREHTNEMIAHTYAMVDLIDENVGKILVALEEEGLMEETIIIFTSDHGELMGDHGLWTKGPFFYEGLVNIPLIITARNYLKPAVSDNLISSVDIFPTIFELLGLSVPEYVDGISQEPHLLDPATCVRDKCLIEYRNGYGENDCSSKVLVTQNLKYVRYQTGENELTDLEKDPHELKNVAQEDDYRDIANKMKEMLLDEILATESKWPRQVSHA